MITTIVPIKRNLLIEKIGYYDDNIMDYFLNHDGIYNGVNNPNNFFGCDLIEIENRNHKIYLGRDVRLIGESANVNYDNYDGSTYEMSFTIDFIDDDLSYAFNDAICANFYFFKIQEGDKDYYPTIDCIHRVILKTNIEINYNYTDIPGILGISPTQRALTGKVINLKFVMKD